MVICKSKAAAEAATEAATEAAAGKLGCRWVASDMQEKDKHSIISAWLQCLAVEDDNHKCVLVGTTAIGTGINPAHINLVVHLGDLWDLVNYVQESGCAGHSGQPALAVLLTLPSSASMVTPVKEYIAQEECWHLVLSTFTDADTGAVILQCFGPSSQSTSNDMKASAVHGMDLFKVVTKMAKCKKHKADT